MASLSKILTSSVGKKFIMGLTGLIWIGFLLGHLSGNLLIFAGQHAINSYSAFLHSVPELLWLARIGLIVSLGLHIIFAILLTKENKQARPQNYLIQKPQKSTWASRTMGLSGLVVLAYVIYHLLHFTFLVTHPEISHLMDHSGMHDIYNLLVYSFKQPLLVIFYVISLALLCSHLSHGIQSMFHSLGFTNKEYSPMVEKFGMGLALLFFIGYSAIPLSVLLGIVRPVL